jgi:hypothetical protein
MSMDEESDEEYDEFNPDEVEVIADDTPVSVRLEEKYVASMSPLRQVIQERGLPALPAPIFQENSGFLHPREEAEKKQIMQVTA